MNERLYDRSFVLATISQACFVVANTLMAHYARWIEFLGGNLAQIGWIMGMGASISLVFRPWMAGWINRLGAKTMWGIGYAVFGVGALGNLLITGIDPLIYLCRACNLFGTAIVFASSLTYVSQTTPEARRTEAIGILGMGGFFGMLLGPYLGDVFLGDGTRARGDFVWLFIVSAAANLLPAVMLFFLRTPKSDRVRGPVRLSEFMTICRRYWPGMIVIVNIAFGICMTAPFVFLATFIDEASITIKGASVIAVFFWCYAGVAISIRLLFRKLPDRVGSRKVLTVGTVLMSVGMAAYSLVDSQHPWLIVVPAVLGGAGHGLMFHTMTSLTLERFPVHVRGTGSALGLMMMDVGMLLGAPLLGRIGDHFGYASLFFSIGAICLLSMSTYLLTYLRQSVIERSSQPFAKTASAASRQSRSTP